MIRGYEWRKQAHVQGLKLLNQGKHIRARVWFVAVILDARKESRANG